MKKKIIFLLIFIIIICTNICCGYSTDLYSISLPYSYSVLSENSFASSNGNIINIEAIYTKPPQGFKYNNEYLNNFVRLYEEDLKENMQKAIKKVLNEYEISLSTNEIEMIVNSLKVKVENQEITNCTKNNYQCFCIYFKATLNDNSLYGKQYIIVSNNYLYTINITTYERSYLYSSELTEIINSLTFNNYKKIENNWDKIIITTIVAIINIIIYSIYKKNTRKAKEENNIETSNYYQEKDNINNLKTQDQYQSQPNAEPKEDKLPMAWYSFYVYVRLPFAILVEICSIINIYLNNYEIAFQILLSVLIVLFEVFLIYSMHKRKKNGFTYITVFLVLESIAAIFNTLDTLQPNLIALLFSIALIFGVWFTPNYIYFKKRKDIFIN